MDKLKILLLGLSLAITLTYSSCGSDSEEIDPIIGKWYLDEIIGDNGPRDVPDCRKLTFFEYKADGTFVNQSVGTSNPGCYYGQLLHGTWEKLSDNEFRITFVDEPFKGTTNHREYFFEGKNKLYVEGSLSTVEKGRFYYIKK